MVPLENDRWKAQFMVSEIGRYLFTVEAWVDHFKTWRRDLAKKVEAGQDVSIDLLIGSKLIAEASKRAAGSDQKQLLEFSQFLQTRNDLGLKIQLALDSGPGRITLSDSLQGKTQLSSKRNFLF